MNEPASSESMSASGRRLAALRREYTLTGLKESDLDPDPVAQFQKWFDEAVGAELTEPNAMILATVVLPVPRCPAKM